MKTSWKNPWRQKRIRKRIQRSLSIMVSSCMLISGAFVPPVLGSIPQKVTVTAMADSTEFIDTSRLAGNEYFQTAIEVSKQTYHNGATSVVLSTGDNFPDALAGVPLARKLDAPLLLTSRTTLYTEVEEEINRLHPKKVYILGGKFAVSQEIEDKLRENKYDIERIGGYDLFGTARLIAQEIGNNGKAIIVNGRGFADAMSISSWAAYNGIPILLTEKDQLPEETLAALKERGVTQTYIIGGTAVVSRDIEDYLRDAGMAPTRYAGNSLYDTNVTINRNMKTDTKTIFLASGLNFQDALAGAVLASRDNSTLLLTGAQVIPSVVSDFCTEVRGNVAKLVIFGGTAVVSNEVLDSVKKVLSQKQDKNQTPVTGRGGSGGGNGDPVITVGNPIIELVDDNGMMEFIAKEIDSHNKYTLNIIQSQNGNTRSIEVDATKPVIVPKEGVSGLYHYKLSCISPSEKTSESNVISYLVTNTGSGIINDDLDEDGLTSNDEILLNTDPNKHDTDGDGLNDGYEYFILNTDPTKVDTDGDEISDAEEDLDSDGLSNLQEYVLGTNPLIEDTDNDGFKDKEEVDNHKTNPLLSDTDEDSLSDYDDVLLGFDPLKKDSDDNGILDCDEKIEQNIADKNIADTLSKDNDAIPSLSVLTKGNVNRTAAVLEYKGAEFGDSRSIIGKAIELTGFEFESAKIEFNISSDISPIITMEDKSFSKLLICYYDEEGNTVYLRTMYDATTNTLSAEIDEAGVYFVLDVETLFGELGLELPIIKASRLSIEPLKKGINDTIEPEEGKQSFTDEELLLMQNPTPEESPKLLDKEDSSLDEIEVEVVEELRTESESIRSITEGPTVMAQADVVFLVDTTGSMGDEINNVKNNIKDFVDMLKSKGIAPNFALIDFQDITYDGMDSTRVHKNGASNWFSNADSFKQAISDLSLGNGGDTPECDVDALETGRLLNLRPSAGKFFVLVTDANYKVANRYEIPSMGYEIELLKNANISTSVVAPEYLEATYRDLYTETGGIYVDIYGDFYNELMSIADKIGEIVDDGEWVYLDGPVPVPAKLKELPTAGSEVDTDEDGIYDVDELLDITPSKEVNLDEIITTASGGIITGTSYGVVNTYRYKSNPAVADTDYDGYEDIDDLAPKEEFITPVVLLHGRGDNTAGCFGVETRLFYNNKKLNDHFNSQNSLEYKDFWGTVKNPALNYNLYSTHFINAIVLGDQKEKTPQNLGYELQSKGYLKNKNLFAFNYPNEDMTKANAKKLSKYLDSLADFMSSDDAGNYFYATKQDKLNKKISVNLIGHSNGGLVSRYYIENMNGSSNVKELITIDTPHWGSGLADISDNLTTCYPMDIDLNPDNAIYGGSYKEYSSLNPLVKKKLNYINENQTDELKYETHGSTKYYFLAGYDVAAFVDVPIAYLDNNLTFDLDIEDIGNFGEYKEAFKNSFINNSVYSELATNEDFKHVFDLKLSDGDNVVNNQSQLGMKFNDDEDSSILLKRIPTEKMWMNIDTFLWHNAKFCFHSQNQHRKETIDKVIELLD